MLSNSIKEGIKLVLKRFVLHRGVAYFCLFLVLVCSFLGNKQGNRFSSDILTANFFVKLSLRSFSEGRHNMVLLVRELGGGRGPKIMDVALLCKCSSWLICPLLRAEAHTGAASSSPCLTNSLYIKIKVSAEAPRIFSRIKNHIFLVALVTRSVTSWSHLQSLVIVIPSSFVLDTTSRGLWSIDRWGIKSFEQEKLNS